MVGKRAIAINEIKNKSGVEDIVWNDKLYITRDMAADFFEVDIRTISRYLEQNNEELSENGYMWYTALIFI